MSKMEDFTGITRRAGTWRAQITADGTHYQLGAWPTAEQAALAYDCAALHLRGEGHAKNIPGEATAKSPRQLQREAYRARAKARGDASLYRGVSETTKNEHAVWFAQVSIEDEVVGLGEYAQEEDAARAYDAAVRFYREGALTNFEGEEALPVEEIRRRCKALKHEKDWPGKRRHTSRYRGVHLETRSGLWRAQLTTSAGENIPLGYYYEERGAAHAYDEAARVHFGEKAWTNEPRESTHSNIDRRTGAASTAGWVLRWQVKNERRSIFFSDSRFGGRWAALRVALQYRDDLVVEGKRPGGAKPRIQIKQQGGHMYVQARIRTPKDKSRFFPLREMSLREAVRRAAAWRYEKLASYYKEHNPYNSAEHLYEEALASVQG